MKKPLKNIDRPDLKHLFSHDETGSGAVSKAGVRKKNSLKTIDPKDHELRVSRQPGEHSSGSSVRGRSSRSSKSLKNLDTNEMEFLVSHDTEGRSSVSISTQVRMHIVLLLVGLIGTVACLWAMIYTSHSEEVVTNLGLGRVANSLDDILSLLAYPVLLFTVILTAYSTQQLYLAYRRANYLDSGGRPGKR